MPDEKLRIIQAGVGGHGRTWAFDTLASSRDFTPVALADPNADALDAAGDALGVPHDRRFASLDDAVASVQADAVLSVTPPAVHPAHARLAFDNGLHLLVEKPLADDLDTARAMADHAAATGRQLVVGQNRRFDAEPVALRDALRSGVVGDFAHGHVDFWRGHDFRTTFRRTMPHVLLIDMAVHHVDLARFILGRDVQRVYATDFNTPASRDGGYFDNGPALRMVLTLDDGTVVSYAGDWSARGKPDSWHGHWKLQGTTGRLTFDDDAGLAVTRGGLGQGEVTHERLDVPDAGNSRDALLADFARAIRTGTPAETDARDNLKTLAAVLAAAESCETGRAIDVPT